MNQKKLIEGNIKVFNGRAKATVQSLTIKQALPSDPAVNVSFDFL